MPPHSGAYLPPAGTPPLMPPQYALPALAGLAPGAHLAPPAQQHPGGVYAPMSALSVPLAAVVAGVGAGAGGALAPSTGMAALFTAPFMPASYLVVPTVVMPDGRGDGGDGDGGTGGGGDATDDSTSLASSAPEPASPPPLAAAAAAAAGDTSTIGGGHGGDRSAHKEASSSGAGAGAGAGDGDGGGAEELELEDEGVGGEVLSTAASRLSPVDPSMDVTSEDSSAAVARDELRAVPFDISQTWIPPDLLPHPLFTACESTLTALRVGFFGNMESTNPYTWKGPETAKYFRKCNVQVQMPPPPYPLPSHPTCTASGY